MVLIAAAALPDVSPSLSCSDSRGAPHLTSLVDVVALLQSFGGAWYSTPAKVLADQTVWSLFLNTMYTSTIL